MNGWLKNMLENFANQELEKLVNALILNLKDVKFTDDVQHNFEEVVLAFEAAGVATFKEINL